ncbi:hypothetical protein QJS04_geneDACA018955 [Acorus gramineus]|uniref:C2 NT-type domain-containing protein n=1 Tax=Acorus gramineus TaxID=55184 RepID=A0AAV9AEB6_ACOGR|nr:hypothetical protein QJS04_geneDACA018955 [Acorus gramineus]
MAAEPSERRNSNSQLLHELESLSQSLYQSHTARRTASLVLPRSSAPPSAPLVSDDHPEPRNRHRRLSMSPWRSRPKPDHHIPTTAAADSSTEAVAATTDKKGIWNWKPMRALSHIGMHKLGCLFSVEVVAVQGLPASMNGLRLSVHVRKKETRDGAVQTMPSRVLQGCADFEEMLFIRCHIYCTGGGSDKKPLQLEPRPFLVSVLAIDAPELDFGKSSVDLSALVRESMERNLEGVRLKQREARFGLSGKARGGELVLKLGFQIMEDGGVGLYGQHTEAKRGKHSAASPSSSTSSPFARKHSKSSFSVTSPRIPSRSESFQSSVPAVDVHGMDELNLDEPASPPPPQPQQPAPASAEAEADIDVPDFEVVDKGVEILEEGARAEGGDPPDSEAAAAGEVVKEVVVGHDPAHERRMTELDSIAKQIMALESMIGDGNADGGDDGLFKESEPQRLDAEEETVTREFLQMLELEERKSKFDSSMPKSDDDEPFDSKSYLSDLGKGLGPVVQTRDGGYLMSTNPFDVIVSKRESPKLAMQLSRPLVLPPRDSDTGFEVFQRMAALGADELSARLLSVAAMDELTGKTAEQVAFEGIASAIVSARGKEEGASSSAARSIAAVKAMASAMAEGRRERIVSGIWNVREGAAVAAEEMVTFAAQKIEAMAVEAVKVQAEMGEEDAPFEMSPLATGDERVLSEVVPLEEWVKRESGRGEAVTVLVVVQMRDTVRRYEVVGAPMVVLVQGVAEEEERFKVVSLHVGGLKVRGGGGKRSVWDAEKQRLTAAQWLVAYGMGKAGGKKGKNAQQGKGGQDSMWSLSARVMADMWIKSMRNPDVKFPK